MSTAATRVTPKKRAKFLKALAESGSVTAAARAAGMSRITAWRIKKRDEEFAAAWEDALEQAIDLLEAEVYRRAYEGDLVPVYQGGQLVGHIRKTDTTLAIFLLKANRPHKYRDHYTHKHTGEITLADAKERLTHAVDKLSGEG